MSLYQFVLFLHVTVAIIAFGASFAFPFLMQTASKDPQHVNFALRVVLKVTDRWMEPAFVVMPFLGLWLIYLADWDLWRSEWLVISIAIYIVAWAYGLFVQRSLTTRLIQLTSVPTQGPPPLDLLRLAKRSQLGGIFLALAVVSIALLMVWKPGGEFVAP